MKRNVLLVLFLGAMYVMSSVSLAENSIEMLYLRGAAPAESNDRLAATRSRALERLARKRAEMRANGYIAVSPEEIAAELNYLGLEPESAAVARASVELNFDPLEFDPSTLGSFAYVGQVRPDDFDPNTNLAVHMLSHGEIGEVAVAEYSFATDEDSERFGIAQPPNNIRIGDLQAGYLVMRVDKAHGTGVSHIWFVTQEKYIKLIAYTPIAEGSRAFEEFRGLAVRMSSQHPG